MPADPPDPDLLARVQALERRVATLEAERAHPLRPATDAASTPPVVPPPLTRRFPTPGVKWAEVNSEDVLGKVGIALLLVGVLFLLKYTLDRELLTPAVRVGGAGAIGGVLLVLGLRLRDTRPTLGRLLTGGGIAALYGSLWAAALLYPLLPTPVAFVGMAAVAALALWLAVREEDAALSVVGTLGALTAPLLLYRDPGQVPTLIAYTALVLVGAAAVYGRHGWRTLLASAALGGWGVILVTWLVGLQPGSAGATGLDRIAFTLGVLVVWATTGLAPILRPLRATADVSPTPTLFSPAGLAIFAAPLLAFGFLDAAWAWFTTPAAIIALALAAAYGAGAHRLRASPALYEPFVLAAAVLAVWGIARAIGADDSRTFGAAVAVGCAVVAVARQTKHRELEALGHVGALGAALVLFVHLFFAAPGASWLAPKDVVAADQLRETLAALLGAVSLAYVGFTSVKGSWARAVYLSAAHLVVLLLMRLLLRPFPQGQALTSTVWGVYAVALVAGGLRLRDDVVRQIGLGTVLVTVAKVLILDLSSIPTLWRVLLFMGLGALLLMVSYFVPALLRGAPDAPPPLPPDEDAPRPTADGGPQTAATPPSADNGPPTAA